MVIVTINLDEKEYETLKNNAKKNLRSIKKEALFILKEMLKTDDTERNSKFDLTSNNIFMQKNKFKNHLSLE